jgi:hypothetical protein
VRLADRGGKIASAERSGKREVDSTYILTKAAMAPDAPPIRPWSRNSPFPAMTAKCFGSVWDAVRCRFPRFYHQHQPVRETYSRLTNTHRVEEVTKRAVTEGRLTPQVNLHPTTLSCPANSIN